MTIEPDDITPRLEYLRGEIQAERISYGELAELQDLAEHIDPSDTELLEWAGVPEDDDERATFFAGRAAGTLAEFLARTGITADAQPAPSNPNADADHWAAEAQHWTVTLAQPGGRTLAVSFSQGSAHTKPPTAHDLLDCLAADAGTVADGQSFEDWAADLGYDTDSRRAERTYRAVVDQTARLRAFLSPEDFDALLAADRD